MNFTNGLADRQMEIYFLTNSRNNTKLYGDKIKYDFFINATQSKMQTFSYFTQRKKLI